MSILNKLSEKSQDNAVILMGGCGTEGNPHNDIISFLEEQKLEVYHLNRLGDIKLGEIDGAIEIYLQETRDAVDLIVKRGKRVHLWGNSFGGFLALKVCEEINDILSIVVVAPIIDPNKALLRCTAKKDENNTFIILPDGRELPIMNNNIEYLVDKQPKIILPDGLILLGERDGLTDTSELDNIHGRKLNKHIIDGAEHGKTTSNQRTLDLTRDFYRELLQK